MIQVGLVSLYGDKDAGLVKLITECQAAVRSACGHAFEPYDIGQVHATIVGLECGIEAGLYNRNFWTYRRRRVDVDFDGFLAYLRSCQQMPFTVQIGGFEDRDYPFRSDPFETGHGTRPYDRSFSLQGEKVMVMGWPIRGMPLTTSPATSEELVKESRLYPATLDELRRAAQKFGILHAYHRTETAVDNDLYFRIGLVDPAAMPLSFVSQVRRALSARSPLMLQITLDDLFVAAYSDERLPLVTTRVWSVADRNVDGQFIAKLFDER